jgi:hypothetical protein
MIDRGAAPTLITLGTRQIVRHIELTTLDETSSRNQKNVKRTLLRWTAMLHGNNVKPIKSSIQKLWLGRVVSTRVLSKTWGKKSGISRSVKTPLSSMMSQLRWETVLSLILIDFLASDYKIVPWLAAPLILMILWPWISAELSNPESNS